MHNRKQQICTPANTDIATGSLPAEALRPYPEVVPTAKRRTFSKAEKLRIRKGVARYTANFAPPAAAFPNS